MLKGQAEFDDDALDENGVVKDGRSIRVPLMMRDGGAGRPGSTFDYAAAARVKEQAYQDAKREMSDAWRTPPVAQPAPAGAAPVEVEAARPAIPVTDADFARLRQIRDEAYRAMVAELANAWRGPVR